MLADPRTETESYCRKSAPPSTIRVPWPAGPPTSKLPEKVALDSALMKAVPPLLMPAFTLGAAPGTPLLQLVPMNQLPRLEFVQLVLWVCAHPTSTPRGTATQPSNRRQPVDKRKRRDVHFTIFVRKAEPALPALNRHNFRGEA